MNEKCPLPTGGVTVWSPTLAAPAVTQTPTLCTENELKCRCLYPTISLLTREKHLTHFIEKVCVIQFKRILTCRLFVWLKAALPLFAPSSGYTSLKRNVIGSWFKHYPCKGVFCSLTSLTFFVCQTYWFLLKDQIKWI